LWYFMVVWADWLWSPVNTAGAVALWTADTTRATIWSGLGSLGMSFLLAEFADVLGIDFPPETFGKARRGTPGSDLPRAVRGKDSPEGLPHLDVLNQERVDSANRKLWLAVRAVEISVRAGRAGYFECARHSFVWEHPAVRRLLMLPNISSATFDMCQFGSAWKRPTKLLVWGAQGIPLALCKFCVGRGGRCSDGRKHMQRPLLGIVPAHLRDGYPTLYCQALLRHLS